MTAEEKLERFCYIGDDRNIKARYIDGELLEQEFRNCYLVCWEGEKFSGGTHLDNVYYSLAGATLR